MLVKYWMKKDVHPITVDDSMHEAIRIMRQYRPALLPVMKKGKLVGVITDRDLKRASASDATSLEVHEIAYLISRIKAKEIMTREVITIPPDYTLEEAAAKLMVNDISSMPVVDDEGKIYGVISKREIFQALISLSSYWKRGVQWAFEIEDRPGSIKEITDIIRNHGARLVSLFTSYERVAKGRRRLYVRAWQVNREKLRELEEELRERATLLYVVDHKENKRQEYVARDA